MHIDNSYFANGHSYEGYGDIYANKFMNYAYSNGHIYPGNLYIGEENSSGTLNIHGDFWQTNSDRNKVYFDIFGCSDYDRLSIDGNAVFHDGFFEIYLSGGYDPEIGNLFNILHVDGSLDIDNAFDFKLPDLSGGKWWKILTTGHEISLMVKGPASAVVPEPASVGIFFISALALFFRRK